MVCFHMINLIICTASTKEEIVIKKNKSSSFTCRTVPPKFIAINAIPIPAPPYKATVNEMYDFQFCLLIILWNFAVCDLFFFKELQI